MAEIFTIKVRIFGRRFLKTRAGANYPMTSHPRSVDSRALVRMPLRSKNQNYKVLCGKNGKKYCIVPWCFNSTIKTPDKLFFYVPEDPKMGKKWMAAVKRVDTIGPKTKAHCCEDLFNVFINNKFILLLLYLCLPHLTYLTYLLVYF